LGEQQKALEYYNRSLRLSRDSSYGEAGTLYSIGRVYSQLGERQKALEYYNQFLSLRRAIDDCNGEAITLSNMALVRRELGNLTEALNDIEASIKIIEDFRSQRTAPACDTSELSTSEFGTSELSALDFGTSELSTSYLATVQDYYEFYIDLLMQLHQANPNPGYDIKASEARKRASNP